jgi:uncharacterized coiled-coil protein SlyX
MSIFSNYSLLFSIATSLIGLIITFGIMKYRIDKLEERTTSMEKDIETLKTNINCKSVSDEGLRKDMGFVKETLSRIERTLDKINKI